MSQEVSTVFKYNGAEYEFDIRDADMAETYNAAYKQMAQEEKEIDKAGELPTVIKANCEMLRRFFDRILGNNAGVSICGKRFNITNHYDAYGAFLDFVKLQSDDITRAKNTFTKYSNRSQRRAAGKGKKQ